MNSISEKLNRWRTTSHPAQWPQPRLGKIVAGATGCPPVAATSGHRMNRSCLKQFLAGWLMAALLSVGVCCQGGSVASVSPAPGSVVTNLTQVTVTFANNVTGVAPTDLFLNSVPGKSVSGTGAVYTYTFDPPVSGIVVASWNVANVITVLNTTNRLTDLSSNSWQYTLLNVVPPVASAITPVPGATLKQLTQIVVNFTEPVIGVTAAALHINGATATSVSGSGAGPYTFNLKAPDPGNVQVSWVSNSGITDLSGNPFTGGNWTYSIYPGQLTGDVIINEFLANNASTNGLRDEDGQLESWIELYNRGTGAVNLLGWSLTVDPAVTNMWTFPAVTLGPGGYLVVFASAKNRTPINGAPLHTSFMLAPSGGQYLGLFDANQPAVATTQFLPNYPAQQADISYGLYGTNFTYLTSPTPGAVNAPGITFYGAAAAPLASVQSGFFNQSFVLSLSTATSGATIRYTLDNSEPTSANGILYNGPITVAGSPSQSAVNVRAVAIRPDLLVSPISTFSYIFPSAVLQQPALPTGFPSNWTTIDGAVYSADYKMNAKVLTNGNYSVMALQALTNLPALSIVLNNGDLFSQQSGIYANPFPPFSQRAQWEHRASFELIMPDGSTGFKINAGLTAHGGISRDPGRTRKHSFDLKASSTYDGSLNSQVFEDSPRKSFNKLQLGAGNNIRWATIPDPQSYQDQLIRDEYSYNLQLATGHPSGHSRWVNLFLNGLYWGVYYIHEEPDDNFAAAYYGGSSKDYDVMRNTSSGLEVQSGNNSAWTNMMALVNSGLINNAQYAQLRQYLDIDQFIDYMIVKFWAGDMDWGMHNWYAFRLRAPGAGFKFQTYDGEWTLINPDDDVTGRNDVQSPTGIHSFLRNNAEYRLRFADRVQRLFFNGGLFSVNSNSPAVNLAQPSNNIAGALYMQHEAVIDIATVLESARWGDDNNSQYGSLTSPFTRNVEFLNELNRLKTTYFPYRSGMVLDQLRTGLLFPPTSGVQAPAFNQPGGSVPRGFNLTMSAPVGTIYYTTNGVDPHVLYSTSIAPDALVYSGSPVVLNQTMTIKARALNGTTWSPLTELTFTVAQPIVPIVITEINYNPPGGSQFEFLELKNTSPAPVDLSGCNITGISYIFPANSIVAPNAVIVLACNHNPTLWALRYPGVPVFGYYPGRLANEGERIALQDPVGKTIISVTYTPAPTNGWPNATNGCSLEINDLNGDPNDPANWRSSSVVNNLSGGTPGTISATPPAGIVQINEIMAQNNTTLTNGGSTPDWLELVNTGSSPVSLTGWSLSNDSNARKFIFPAGANIAAGGFLLVFCDSQTNAPGLHSGFCLNSTNGESLFLYDTQTNRIDAITFGPQVADLSVGRVNGIWQLTQPTPGAPNQSAAIGVASSLMINEWMASSLPGQSDWFELYNASSLPVPLKGLYLSSSNAMFQMKSLSFVPPGGFVQLIADKNPGPNHVDFKLPAPGDTLGLYDQFGVPVDSVTFGPQADGISQGRLPDGSTNIVFFSGSASPGASNYQVAAAGVRLNEVMARNSSAVLNPWGDYSDWIELYNPGTSATNLSGLSLSVNQMQAGQWVFPAGTTIAAGGYLLIWCDATQPATSTLQADFNLGQSLDGNSGSVYLFNPAGEVLDYVEYGFQIANQAIGRIGGNWSLLASATPGAANAAAAALGTPGNLRINEWMALPASGSGWFELYNLDPLPVSLSGLVLSDNPSDAGLAQFQIAPLSFIAGQGWINWNADGHPSNGRNHVNFQLTATGESLLLYGTNSTVIDAVYYSGQQTGVSQGRLPDGSGTIVPFATTASPGAANYLPLTLQTGAGGAGGMFQLQFTAVAGLSYTVQVSTNLAAGTWSKFLDVPAGPTSRPITVTAAGASSAPNHFYRIVTPIQP